MAENYQFSAEGHPSIYSENPKPREFNVYFSTPSEGVNEDTGILLLIAGFGGHANSNVYKKMREQFADQYNLVTVQCDYFGYEFMQESASFEFPDFKDPKFIYWFEKKFGVDVKERIYNEKLVNSVEILELIKNENISISGIADLNETSEYFCDMGIMQAIDNITAVVRVIGILYDNEYTFNTKKVLSFGSSHGGYLCYLANILSPNLFSGIIDNSAWVYPVYSLKGKNRMWTKSIGNLKIRMHFKYLASKIINPNDFLDLNVLYKLYDNGVKVISYHGQEDSLSPLDSKLKFLKKVSNHTATIISKEGIDNKVFYTADHGLGANYIELFALAINEFVFFEKSTKYYCQEKVQIDLGNTKFEIDYSNLIPQIIIKKNNFIIKEI